MKSVVGENEKNSDGVTEELTRDPAMEGEQLTACVTGPPLFV